MELLQLKYFCDAAQTENFSKTARKYYVPTSNISQTIKRLETELGTELFSRKKNQLTLNEQGRIFYKEIKKALDKIEEAKLQLKDFQETVSGEVKILALTNRRIITKAIESFKAEYPLVTFILNHNNTADAEKFDIIIADEDFYAKNYTKTVLICEEILLAVKKGHRIENLFKINISDLQSERFITMPSGSSLHSITNRVCRNSGFEPKIAIESDDPYYIRKYIELGLGVSLVPSLSWKGEFSKEIVLKELNNIHRKTCMFMPENIYLTKAVMLFSKMLTEVAKTY